MNSGYPSPALGQSPNKTNSPQHSWETGLEPTWHRGLGTWGSHGETYKLVSEWVLSAILVWADRIPNSGIAPVTHRKSWDMTIQVSSQQSPVWPSLDQVQRAKYFWPSTSYEVLCMRVGKQEFPPSSLAVSLCVTS